MVDKNKLRIRKRRFNLCLLDEEMDILKIKAGKARMSMSEYLRNMILFGAAGGKAMFTSDDARRICYELNRIGNNINQVAYQANVNCAVSENDFNALRAQYVDLLSAFDSLSSAK